MKCKFQRGYFLLTDCGGPASVMCKDCNIALCTDHIVGDNQCASCLHTANKDAKKEIKKKRDFEDDDSLEEWIYLSRWGMYDDDFYYDHSDYGGFMFSDSDGEWRDSGTDSLFDS